VAREGAADGVGQAEVDRPAERDADDEHHEDHRGRDEGGREHPALLEEVAPPAFPGRDCGRFHAAAILKYGSPWPRSSSRA
jgi:hypothetical protein